MSRNAFRRMFLFLWLSFTPVVSSGIHYFGLELRLYHAPQTLAEHRLWLMSAMKAFFVLSSFVAAVAATLTFAISWLFEHAQARFRTSEAVQTLARKCQNCDYDLTGNVSGTCPECGHNTAVPVDRDRFWRIVAWLNAACWPTRLLIALVTMD